jgi:hypothetical protein
MSTLLYAQLTNKREEAQPGMSVRASPPGVQTYVDALAALVPAEVLTLHGLMLSATTEITAEGTKISDASSLKLAFYGLVVVSMALYVTARLLAKKWDSLDYVRVFIPPAAFLGWTMLQRSTAFDALAVSMTDGRRTVLALFLAVIVGAVAVALAYKADQKAP